MAITVKQAGFTRTLYRAVLLSGLQNPDFAEPKVKDDAPFTLADFKEAVMMADFEMALLIADTLDHPYRNHFFTETPEFLKNGDRLPVALGPHSKVVIGIDYDGDGLITLPPDGDDEEVKGRVGRNRQHVERTIEFPEIFGPGKGLYFIEHGHIYFVGSRAQVFSPTINLDRAAIESTNLLQCPDAYSNGIIANSYKMLYMSGQDLAQRSFYLDQAETFNLKIKNKDLDLPKPERFQQLNG